MIFTESKLCQGTQVVTMFGIPAKSGLHRVADFYVYIYINDHKDAVSKIFCLLVIVNNINVIVIQFY